MRRRTALLALGWLLAGCSTEAPDTADRPAAAAATPPSIVLVTLDTTRADALEQGGGATPRFDALRQRGRSFSQAYTTAPTTLPAHASMMTGLLPIDHGIHENARYLSSEHPLLAERLRAQGYRTAAFVSGYPLARVFGLARGFDHYDDDLGGAAERRAAATTDRALAWLAGQKTDRPIFLWVHYFDPHEPYEAPEPFRSTYADDPYRGEIAYLDQQLGRLVDGVDRHLARSPWHLLAVGDHGEGLGEHGEALHGHLLYQATMRVPLIVVGEGIEPGQMGRPVSVRQVFDTVLHWAGLDGERHLLSDEGEIVVGEAMKPFLQYGWQPQVMVVDGRLKMIRAGVGDDAVEIYDVLDDPAESVDLAGEVEIARPAERAARDVLERMLEAPAAPPDEPRLSEEDRRRLASLGYAGGPAIVRPLRGEAPKPKDMTHLFADLDAASAAFVQQDYQRAIVLFEQLLERDPHNLTVALRLAVAHSVLGRDAAARRFFDRARQLAPQSADVQHYLAMHLLREGERAAAAALFESVLAAEPRRVPALESLARIRLEQGDLEAAAALLERAVEIDPAAVDGWRQLGRLKMARGDTDGAIDAFERARELEPAAFEAWLELGVLYLASQQLEAARDALDRVPGEHPGYPMALFKRAQVSVLLGESDRRERVRAARAQADRATAPLIEREPLFRDLD